MNFGLSPRFEFITLSPFFNYNEIWYSKYISRYTEGGNVITQNNSAVKALRYFDMGVSFSTRLIGIFTPRSWCNGNSPYSYTIGDIFISA